MKFLPMLFSCLLLATPTVAQEADADTTAPSPVTDEAIRFGAQLIGLDFTQSERDTMLPDLEEALVSYEELRDLRIPNEVSPALVLDISAPPSWAIHGGAAKWSDPGEVTRPDDVNELAFWPVAKLAVLVRTKQVTSVELTRLALDRLEKFGPQLECVITLLPDRALAQAAAVDEEIAAGQYRGLLHGIPWGAKDLLAVAGAPTTWGAEPYREQRIGETATVVKLLDEAGAILVAKLTLGALAWGDVWFDGTTRNPWNLEQGSSGSSAGSASAVSAGLVPFAIGTETWGSIVSPSTRCGVTGLRPTFGRVSRAGAMALSWTMDKIGPICREVEDCAMVFDAIRGVDEADPTTAEYAFPYRPDVNLAGLKIGYVAADFEEDYPSRDADLASLDVLRSLGIELIPIELPDYDYYMMSFVLSAEAAAAFDELTLSDRDDEMVSQVRYAWPNVFRGARLIPAVEYIQAMRARRLVIEEMATLMQQVDVYLAPSFSDNLLLTNLTGHPCVVIPNGLGAEQNTSISFTGRLYDEATVLAVARACQEATDFHRQHPPGYGE